MDQMYTKVSLNIRSLCSLVCKWNYRAGSGDSSKDGWDWPFLNQIGLGAQLKLEQLGTEVVSPGSSVARGLSEKAARELGLNSATKVRGIFEFEHGCDGDQKGCLLIRPQVGASMIDAHAGALGMLASPSAQGQVCQSQKYF